jgi:hypothetical protein
MMRKMYLKPPIRLEVEDEIDYRFLPRDEFELVLEISDTQLY